MALEVGGMVITPCHTAAPGTLPGNTVISLLAGDIKQSISLLLPVLEDRE